MRIRARVIAYSRPRFEAATMDLTVVLLWPDGRETRVELRNIGEQDLYEVGLNSVDHPRGPLGLEFDLVGEAIRQ